MGGNFDIVGSVGQLFGYRGEDTVGTGVFPDSGLGGYTTAGHGYAGPRPGRQGMHVGTYASAGFGLWISNARTPAQLSQMTDTFYFGIGSPIGPYGIPGDYDLGFSISWGDGVWLATFNPPWASPKMGMGFGAELGWGKATPTRGW